MPNDTSLKTTLEPSGLERPQEPSQIVAPPKLSRLNRFRQQLRREWVPPLLIFTNAVSFLAFGILLYVHLTTRIIDWKLTSEVFKNFGEVIALIAGGAAAYYRFFRGRVFKARLEVSISGRISLVDNQTILIAIGTVKNVGGSIFEMKPGECMLTVTPYTVGTEKGIGTFYPGQSATYSIFPQDERIESGELVKNERLIPLNLEYVAMGLELHVDSKEPRTWYTSTLIEKPKEELPDAK